MNSMKNKHGMKQRWLTILGLTMSCARLVAEPNVPEKEPAAEQRAVVGERTDFIRVNEDASAARLQTGITRYQKGDVVLDLIGAVHVADREYFAQLNEEFTKYESVLFEMVGGENLVNGQAPKPQPGQKVDTMSLILGKAYSAMEKFLALSGQKDHVDYSAENFVHADLTMREFKRLQKQKGESLIGFALKQNKLETKPKKEPNAMKLLAAILTKNSDKAKLELVHTLGSGDDQIAQFAGDSVIIGDRNVKCLDVLEQQINEGIKSLCIFYGAAHFPDMEQRLVESGFKKTSHRWITAWDVKKPQKKKAS